LKGRDFESGSGSYTTLKGEVLRVDEEWVLDMSTGAVKIARGKV